MNDNNKRQRLQEAKSHKRVGIMLPYGINSMQQPYNAIQRLGFLGSFKNKLGTAVGYIRYGEGCLRAYISDPRNPRTAKQVEQRSKFALTSEITSSSYGFAKSGLLNLGKKGPYAAYIGLNIRNAVSGGSFDYSHLVATTMNESLPITMSLSGNQVTASWDTPDVTNALNGGSVHVMAMCETSGHASVFTSSSLSDGSCTLDIASLEATSGDNLHLYAYAATKTLATRTYHKSATVQ